VRRPRPGYRGTVTGPRDALPGRRGDGRASPEPDRSWGPWRYRSI